MGFQQFFDDMKSNISFVLKWMGISIVLGGICGIVGALFHISIDWVTQWRVAHSYIVFLLPIGGMIIVFLYHCVHLEYEPGTNTIIKSVRQQEHVPVLLAPAIFLATVVTHLFGGSSGREGAALQIGGSIASSIGHLFNVDKKNMSILIMCGMSAVFSALFGTPLTATLFSMEVVSVGIFYYAAFVPCLCSSLVSFMIAQLFGCHKVAFPMSTAFEVDMIVVLKLVVFAFVVALFSIVFVSMMHCSHRTFKKYFHNPYIRVSVGGLILMVLVVLFGQNYLGAGMDIVHDAIYDSVRSYDFLLKAIFTAITIGCGFKGGEIVPTFFIGATLGYVLGGFLGLDPHVCAALGLVSMLCCVINSPVTSIVLGIEMFGSAYLIPFAIVAAFGYVLSGYLSLYQAQKIVYSKTSPEYIDRLAK